MRTTTSLLVWLFACGSTDPATVPEDEPPIEVAFPDRCAAASCAAGPTITKVDELAAIIEATSDWVTLGPYTTGCLRASDEIRIAGTMTVRSDDIAVPAFCQERNDCRKSVWFRTSLLQPDPPGVECLEPEYWYEFKLCAALALRDATIRLRPVQQDIHPSAFGNFVPVVDVLPACGTPCGGGEHACEATQTCWAAARDHCAYCLGGSNEACACWNGEAFDPDGTQCEVAVSGDVYLGGTCRAGICETRR